MSDLVYYVGPFSFPNGGAAARRIHGIANSLRASGYTIKIIDGDSINDSSYYDDYPIFNVSERPRNNDGFLKKIFKLLSIGNNTISFIKEQKVLPRYIVLYSGYSPYLLRLIPFCKKHGIKLIFDAVEWYMPKKSVEYIYNPYYWNIELAMRYLIPKCDGVICISQYLTDYYRSKNVPVFNVPPTLSVLTMPKVKNKLKGKKIKLVYTGNPGHKDILNDVISVVDSLEDLYELDIAGVTGENTTNIRYHGYLSHENSLSLLSSSDFSILFRPLNKISQAGFSTKVVESMSCSVPVITNNTGDLSSYITDGNNGYIFDGTSIECLTDKLLAIHKELSADIYEKMSINCFETARKKFDSHIYIKPLSAFFSRI